MDKLATASINNLRIPEANAPPEDPIFVLTASQLRQIITEAVSDAIQPMQEELSELRATVTSQDEELAALKATVAEQKADYEGMNLLRCEDIVFVSRRVNALEKKKDEPRETEIARAEKIRKYLLNRPDHKANYETLKGYLGVDKVRLSEAIKTLMAAYPGQYGFARVQGDKRKRALVMLPR